MKEQLPKVLCVDDEPAVLDALRRQMRRDFDFRVATGPEEALEKMKTEGPFSVIVSDLRMPVMDGAAFLAEAKKRDPDVSTMLLTGKAGYADAMNAVNGGHVFRLLAKPCLPDVLREAIREGVRQRQLVESERILLQQTLLGAVNALTEALATAKPLFFGRARRVKRLAKEIANRMREPHVWRIETAAVFSQLAAITLPDEEAEDVYMRKVLRPEVQDMVHRFPAIVDHLLGNVPRLEDVREILGSLGDHVDRQTSARAEIRRAAAILRVALDYDYLEAEGHERDLILATLRGREGQYDPVILGALESLFAKARSRYLVQEVSVRKLDLGMRLAEDLRLERGFLVAPRGTDVDAHLIQVVRNYLSCHKRNPFPKQVKVSLRGGEPLKSVDGDKGSRPRTQGYRRVSKIESAEKEGTGSASAGSHRVTTRPVF